MNIKKSILSVLLMIVVVLSLTGCENKNDSKESNSKSSNSEKTELYPVKDEETELYGYVNKKGRWVIDPTYVNASGFDNETGLARVRKPQGDYSTQFINSKGEVVIDGCGSYSTKSFHNGYAVVDTNVIVDTYNTRKLIDKDGNEIIPSGKYERITDVSNDGIVGVAESTVSGMKYMKLDGTVILERKYKYGNDVAEGTTFNANGYAYAGKTWFDEQGNEIQKEDYGKINSLNDNNYGFVENGDYKKRIYAIKNEKVEYITDYIYKSTTGFNSKNIAMVNEEYKQPYYLINEEGKKINDKTYKSAEMLLDGKFVVMLEDGKHQVLNEDGSILVDSF